MSYPILITGAAGFIGFHTAKAMLDNGERVIGIDNLNDYYDIGLKKARIDILEQYNDFEFVSLDLSEKNDVKTFWSSKGPFQRVIHLAAQAGVRYSLENPYAYISSNIVGHMNILEQCRHTDNFEHLVYASSSSVYGDNLDLPYSTDQKTDTPCSLYAATKKSDELLSYSYSSLYGIPQTGLRFFTVYGAWGRPDMSYFLFTKAILEGKAINIFNNGNMKRDFTYIDDIVDGVLSASNTKPEGDIPHNLFNLGNSKSENLLDFINVIENCLGITAEKNFMPMQDGDVVQTYADISDTIEKLSYSPKTSIEDGLPIFIDWYKSYYKA